MRRNLTTEGEAAAAARPRRRPLAAPRACRPAAAPAEEMGLDIPTFLRRQNN
ncbi:hypothetical protein ACFFMP_00420 [Pseudoroseomonas cervicalis]|uniref:hypothetical protein n=1 Tax=Teichococcus cervicalis TaxID=204525 RepID=UPI0035E5DA7C